MQLLDLTADELLSTTRSVRRRLDLERPVEPEVIDECLRIALQAPTGSNAQNWHWVVITDQGLRTAIAEYYRTSFTAYITTSRRAIATIADPDRQASQLRVASSAQYLADNLHRVPVFVLGCLEGDPQGYPAWQLPAYWGSLLPAAWSFMLAARARGLGTSLTTVHLRYAAEVGELLGIPANVSQGVLIPVAYTVGTDFKPAPRPPLETVVHRDRW